MKNKIIRVVHFWDSILFKLSNFAQYFIYLGSFYRIKLHLKKNTKLSGRHKGERCFILLNGPSLLDLDLSKIRDEQVFCVNHFWTSEHYQTVKPNYYLASDTSFFSEEFYSEEDNYLKKILTLTKQDGASCIFPMSYLKLLGSNKLDEHVYVTYSKHKPTGNKIRSSLSSLSSTFSTVSLFAINAAIDMGFSEIYLLGYELPPWKGGLMPHAHVNTASELSTEDKLVSDDDMFTQVGLHWQYYQAQLENYYLAKHADRLGVSIYNCNSSSFVRAFDFVNYNDLHG